MKKITLFILLLGVAFLSKAQNKMIRYVCIEAEGEKPNYSWVLLYNPNTDKFKKFVSDDDDEEISLKTSQRSKTKTGKSYKIEMRPWDIKHAYNTLYITVEGDYIKARLPFNDEELTDVRLVFKKEEN